LFIAHPLIERPGCGESVCRWISYADAVKTINRTSPREKNIVTRARFNMNSLKKYPRIHSPGSHITKVIKDQGHNVARKRRV